MSAPQQLTPIEARILGVLIEKQATVPDTYPLSLNTLISGCNQKTARDPIMEVTEASALEALDNLRSHDLVIESSGSRVTRYSHNMARVYQLPTPAVAIVTTLMLRGPQTVAELRANSERLYRFADISSLEAFLEELSTRAAGSLAVQLPRQPGTRENRWAHLLCGEVQASHKLSSGSRADSDDGLGAEVAALREEVATLRIEVAALKAMFD